MPKTEIVSVIIGFYKEEEIVIAKRIIFDISNKLKVEGAPRMKSRKDGTNKCRLDCEDLFDMFEIRDKKSVELPEFHAVNLHRLPQITPSDVDNVHAENISELKEQVAALIHQVNEIMSQMQMMTKLSAAPSDKNAHGGPCGQTGPSKAISKPDHPVVSELDNVEQVSFADMFAKAGKTLTVDFASLLCKFYAAANSICSHTKYTSLSLRFNGHFPLNLG